MKVSAIWNHPNIFAIGVIYSENMLLIPVLIMVQKSSRLSYTRAN